MNRRHAIGLLSGAGAAILARRLPRALAAQAAPADPFRERIDFAAAHNLASLPLPDVVASIGRTFLDTPYVGGTLDVVDPERCVINFAGLDCVTFFELSLDLARIVKKKLAGYDDLVREVTFTRYRQGMLTDFTSRLHYTVDWFYDNERKGVVRNVTRELGGVPFRKRIDFMSTHPDRYRQLRAHPKFVRAIKEFETAINSRPMFYIPRDGIAAAQAGLRTGDIIGITTTIEGIDCSHTGIIVVENSVPRFMHASSAKGKVIIADGSVNDYVQGVSKDTGIMVVRPQEVA